MPSVEGRVTEYYSRMGVPNVLVSVGGRTAVTDAGGYFLVNGLAPNRTHQMTVTHRDFEPYSSPVSIGAETAYTVGDIVVRQTVVRAL